MELALTSKVLIGCRMSPTQKAEIVQLIKFYQPKKITLAIGDGINDLKMMNEANIGVGIISGISSLATSDTGNYALRSSDFAIGQFKHIKPLILFHGRENYRRNAYLIFFIFYKNVLFVTPLFIYGIYSGFSG